MRAIRTSALPAFLLLSGWSVCAAASPKSPPASSESGSSPYSTASRGGQAAAPVPVKHLNLRSDSAVVIYGPDNELGTATVEEAMKIRDLPYDRTPVNDRADLKNLELLPALKAAGMVTPEGRVGLPVISIDGRLYGKEEFLAGLSELPLTNVWDQSTSYIYVYGPPDCVFVQKGQEELEANGFQYEYRNVNDPRYRPRFEALLRAYGFKAFLWPMLEINGRLFSKPSPDVVRTNYR